MHDLRHDSARERASVATCVTIDARSDLLFTMSDNTPLRVFRRDRSEFHFWTSTVPTGGARRDRTDDLLLAKQALSQLSYGPDRKPKAGLPVEARAMPRLHPSGYAGQSSHRLAREGWWAWEDLNFRPHAYQARALTN